MSVIIIIIFLEDIRKEVKITNCNIGIIVIIIIIIIIIIESLFCCWVNSVLS